MSELGQYIFNGLMLGMIYAMVAVGFTLFFGVLDVIKFSHGDVLMVGAFAGLAASVGMTLLDLGSPWLQLLAVVLCAICVTGALGAAIAKYLILPLRKAPPLNTLLATLMLGTVIREAVRLFYPDGSNPKPFPRLLPTSSVELGGLSLRVDNLLLLAAGAAVIVGVHLLITRTRLGMAIRAVAQDGERDERPVLQRDQLQHRPAAGRDRLRRRHPRRPGQRLRRHPRRLSVRRPAGAWQRGAASPGSRHSQCVQGRVRLRRGHRADGLEADRPDRREIQRARVTP
jgi:hypothetical protein